MLGITRFIKSLSTSAKGAEPQMLTAAEMVALFQNIVEGIFAKERSRIAEGRFHPFIQEAAKRVPSLAVEPIGADGNLFLLRADSIVSVQWPDGREIDPQNPVMGHRATLLYLQPDQDGLKVGFIPLRDLENSLEYDNLSHEMLLSSAFVHIQTGHLLKLAEKPEFVHGIRLHVGRKADVHRDRMRGDPDIIFSSVSYAPEPFKELERFDGTRNLGTELKKFIPSWGSAMSVDEWKNVPRSLEPETLRAIKKFPEAIETGFAKAEAYAARHAPQPSRDQLKQPQAKIAGKTAEA